MDQLCYKLLLHMRETAMNNSFEKKLAINPAFFQEIKEDREELLFIERRMKYLLGNQELFRESLSEFKELTEVFRDQLALHFVLEEAYGYFEEAIEVEPRLHQQADKLKRQHTELYNSAQQLCDAVYQEPSLEPDALRQRALDLVASLDEHEAAETSLIQSALYEDVGGGD